MRALIQRVTEASVSVTDDDGSTVIGQIGHGLVALVGVTDGDRPDEADRLAAKLWHLRVFEDDDGAMNRSCAEVGGQVLVVSQFTLYGDARKGRRPSFVAAARPEQAEPLIDHLVARLRALGANVETGRFRARMQVRLSNDGPVTLLLEV